MATASHHSSLEFTRPKGPARAGKTPAVSRLDEWKRRLLERTEAPDNLARTRLRYLPAALELEQTPANPIGRALMWVIVALFIIALLWAGLGKLDVVAVAQGKVVPGGRVKTIQPMALGRVSQIHVQDGDRVEAGDPLVTLDGTMTTAELNKLRNQLSVRQLQLARLAAFSNALPAPDEPQLDALASRPPKLTVSPPLQNHPQLGLEQALLRGQWSELVSRVATMRQQLRAKRAEKAVVKTNARRLNRLLPIQREKTRAQELLYKKDLGAKVQWLDARRALIEQEESQSAERERQRQLTAEIAQLQSQQRQLIAQTRKETLQAQEQSQSEVAELRQELVKAEASDNQQKLTAPIDGTVQQMAVHTLGGVVQPAEPVLQLVPAEASLFVEAWVQNKDIGFVQPGQQVQVKINTYNFTKYGLMEGTVHSISPDAVQDENQSLRYKAHIELHSDHLTRGNRQLPVSPGMTVSAEIMTGKRRIIDYFLSPVKKTVTEAFRER